MTDFSQPYPSQRAPVCADNLVASSQPLAVEAGVDALRRGGNSVDAALATAITLTVVEPDMNGVGSDAFAILWDGNELVGLNASGRAPQAWTADYFAHYGEMPQFGWDSVTVPGAVSAWVMLSERFGKLPFADLFRAAIHYAEDGFPVGPRTAAAWSEAQSLYRDIPSFAPTFSPAPKVGRRVRRADIGQTLRLIAASRGEAFYQGELADKIEAAAIADGGAMRKSDLASHTAEWVTPTAQDYRHVTLHEIPPNGQGLAAQIALGILKHRDPPPLDSADAVHLQIEAMKIAIGAAFEHFADPRAMRLTPEELLAPGSLARAAEGISARASDLPPVSLPISHDTVYLTAADASGKMVSYIQSNYWGFGSGVVIPGTGIAMQNRGWGFTLDASHPNCVGPGKRPFHTIIPGFVTEGGAPRMSFGVMGGHMQHQGHVQMINRMFDHGQNPQAAANAPRWHVYEDFAVGLEAGMPPSLVSDLEKRGHRVCIEPLERVFGGAQIILRTNDGYVGGSDPRKDGLVAGY